jgi:hypothetical protein
MTNNVDVEGSNRLPALAARIKAEHEACDTAMKRGLQHAVAAGRMLIEAKALLKHGQWLLWLRDHCQISERSAQRYMEVAPHATDDQDEAKSDNPADLTTDTAADAPETPKPLSDEWFSHLLDGPFTEDDTDSVRWVCTKLLHQVGAPPVVSMLLTDDDRHDLHLLRLCGFEELEQAGIALAPVATASGKQAIKIKADTVTDLRRTARVIEIVASWLLGGVLNEIERRYARSCTDEDYAREWNETHAAWMASLEAKLTAAH